MSKKVGIIGCGDFLRWQEQDMLASKDFEVALLFDPISERAQKFADSLGGCVAGSAEEIIESADIDIVCLFVPPWLRKDLFIKCAEYKKDIIATKPLANSVESCEEMLAAANKAGIKVAVMYRRTGFDAIEKYKEIFESGEIGELALYKQDWLHHYPTWNKWAVDPELNGGPFMDAMIHNLNIAKYLFGCKVIDSKLITKNLAHPDLKCTDNDLMLVDFENGGTAQLFITWAADLEVFSNNGNDREHIDITYMITNKGWRLTDSEVDGKCVIEASKDGHKKTWVVEPNKEKFFNRFVAYLEDKAPWPSDAATLEEATEDIALVTK